MPLRVPFRLHRREEPAPAAAVLLGSDDPTALLAACARLADPLVFPVAGGFLVVADSIPAGVPSALRLRRLSENCFLPVDADLVPSLLPAEVVDLTSRRGLVFLPNRTPLAFDANKPFKPAAFLAVSKPRRDDWEPLPAGNPPAEQLTAIVRVMPEINPDDLLEGAGPPVGTDDARPPQVGLGRGALGRASAGLGKGLGAIGRLVGSKKLSELGGRPASGRPWPRGSPRACSASRRPHSNTCSRSSARARRTRPSATPSRSATRSAVGARSMPAPSSQRTACSGPWPGCSGPAGRRPSGPVVTRKPGAT